MSSDGTASTPRHTPERSPQLSRCAANPRTSAVAYPPGATYGQIRILLAKLQTDTEPLRSGIEYAAEYRGAALPVVLRDSPLFHFPPRLLQPSLQFVERQQGRRQAAVALGAPVIELVEHRLEETDSPLLLFQEGAQTMLTYRAQVVERSEVRNNRLSFVPTVKARAGEFGAISTGFEASFADHTAGNGAPSPLGARWCGRRAAAAPIAGRHMVKRAKATVDAARTDGGMPLAVHRSSGRAAASPIVHPARRRMHPVPRPDGQDATRSQTVYSSHSTTLSGPE